MGSKRPNVDDIKKAVADAGIDPSSVKVIKVKKGFKLSLFGNKGKFSLFGNKGKQ